MYLFNQPWCGTCKSLRAEFTDNGAGIENMAKKFIMVNVGGDDNDLYGVRASCPCGRNSSLFACKGCSSICLSLNAVWHREDNVIWQAHLCVEG
jgi:hypothetical protein